MRTARGGLTLVELLVVLGIVGIPFAIAVPNLLSAQVRAKVSRAKADLATLSGAVELYAVDQNEYPPNDGRYNVTPVELTTPVEYLTRRDLEDPFAVHLEDGRWGIEACWYTYARIVAQPWSRPSPPIEGVDHPFYNPGAFEKYGKWYQLSIGPDGLYSGLTEGRGNWPTYLFDVPYDPTNGTVSFGNIFRTQKQTEIYRTLTAES